MYENTTNLTNSKGRIHIQYGTSNQYRKIHLEFTEVYQYFFLNIIVVLYYTWIMLSFPQGGTGVPCPPFV